LNWEAERCPATEALTEISKPTPADTLHNMLLADIHNDDSDTVVPIIAAFDKLKCWPKRVNDTAPEAGLILRSEPETSGAEYVNKTDALLRTRNTTETETWLLRPRLAIIFDTIDESEIHTDIDVSEINLTRWEIPCFPIATAETEIIKVPEAGTELVCVKVMTSTAS
jgi:hypothetical protein